MTSRSTSRSRPPLSWRQRLAVRLIGIYPPYLGAGIRPRLVDPDNWIFKVSMPLRFYNRNYVGTHFGGSLYSMCDPFFMLILMQKLGRDYIVWDKASEIRFLKPGRGRVEAEFAIPDERVEVFREDEPQRLREERRRDPQLEPG